jgi:hypothetical protein
MRMMSRVALLHSLQALMAVCMTGTSLSGLATELDPAKITDASGIEAKPQSDGVVRISWSRGDVLVTVDGVRLPSAAGLGSWAAFAPAIAGSRRHSRVAINAWTKPRLGTCQRSAVAVPRVA